MEAVKVSRRMRYLRVVAPLRQAMIYSNVGYSVAREALAAETGTTFEVLVRDVHNRPLQV